MLTCSHCVAQCQQVPGSGKGSSTPGGSKAGGRKGSGGAKGTPKGTPKGGGTSGLNKQLGDGKLDFSRAWRGKAQKLTMQQVPFARHVEAMAAVVNALPKQERGLLSAWNRLVQSPKITNYKVVVPEGVPVSVSTTSCCRLHRYTMRHATVHRTIQHACIPTQNVVHRVTCFLRFVLTCAVCE